MRPVLSDGRAVEEAISGLRGRARLQVILECLQMEEKDLRPNVPLEKNDPNLAEKIDFERFMTDFRYACESFIRIRTKEKGIVPFLLNICQLFFLFHRSGRDLILKARQHGFTTLMLAYYLWDTMVNPGTTTIILAQHQKAAEAALGRLREMYECFPDILKPKLRRDRSDMLAFDALQSEIRIQVISPKAGRSFTCNNLFGTEVSLWEIDEEQMLGVLEAVPIGEGGSITLESTPRGVGNYFHRECAAARLVDGESQFKYFELPYYLNPEYDEEWVELKKRALKYETTEKGRRAWRQEYGCSFEQSQRNYFEKRYCIPTSPHRTRFVEDPLGGPYPRWVWIFEEPIPGEKYVIGADSAQGLEHGDFNCATVLSRRRRREVATIYGKMKEEDFARALFWLARKYGMALLAVEAAGTGHSVLHILLNELFYPNLFYHPNETNPNVRGLGPLGWQTNRRTRPTMLSELRDATVEGAIELAFEHRQSEMEAFQINKNGKPEAPSGYNDDTIMSAAIAHRLLDFPDMLVEEEMELSVGTYGR